MNASLTLTALAVHKKHSVEFLSSLGMTTTPQGVAIPYYTRDGAEIAVKQRTKLAARDGSYWPRGCPLAAYGLWRLDLAAKHAFLILVEGESDCWALWHAGLPALGLPGSGTAKTLDAQTLDGIETLYLHREPDQGGERFVAGVVKRLGELGYAGQVYEVRMPAGCKDPADLFAAAPEQFLARFTDVIKQAQPLTRPHRADDWPALDKLQEAPAPPFPLTALPKPMRELAEEVARLLPCPVDMPACHMLAAAATAIGATRRLEIKPGWHEASQLWIAVVARPGSKKSPAGKFALAPLYQRQTQLRRQYEVELEFLGDDLPKGANKPVPRQVFAADTTREAMCTLLAANRRGLLLYRDELSGWARSLNQYKGGKGDDKQFYLSLWSGEPIMVNRRDFDRYVEQPFLCVSGNIPPGVLRDLHDERCGEDGFIHRVLFAWPDPIINGWTDHKLCNDKRKAYERLIEALFALRPSEEKAQQWTPCLLRLTDEATALLAAFIDDLGVEAASGDFPEALRGPWSKLEGYCARLALVVHVCRQAAGETDASEVDPVSMAAAVAIARYFQGHARRVYPRMGGHDDKVEKDAQAILAWLARNRDRVEAATEEKPDWSFTWSMLRHDLHCRFEHDDSDLQKALELLVEQGYLREVQRERDGRRGRPPKPLYLVHPDLKCN